MALGCYFPYSLITFDVPADRVSWCCKQTEGNTLSSYNPKEYFKDPVLSDLRSSLNNNIKHPLCKSCWDAEESGIQSWRQLEGVIPSHINDIKDYTKQVTRLEIKLDNTCDLACIYCGPWDSTTWQRENKNYKFYNYKPKNYSNPILHEKILQTIREVGRHNRNLEIGFVGGESFLSKNVKDGNVRKYIDEFYETATVDSCVTLKFVSNANTPLKILKKTINVLEATKQSYPNLTIHVALSIESTGIYTESSRFHSNWHTVDNNLNIWLSKKWIHVSINTAFNALTIVDLPNFVNYLKILYTKHNRLISISPNIVYYPEGLTPSVLPDTFSKYIDLALHELQDMRDLFVDDNDCGVDMFILALENIKNTLGSSLHNKEKLKRVTDYCINVRQIDVKKIVPDLYEYLYKS
jgi:hypothetical protein